MHGESVAEIIKTVSFDGYELVGRLTVPESGKISKLVIYVNGSGANTYDNKRNGFNYFDLFADEFSARGIAFYSYSTRGCTIGDEPPMYVNINYDEYKRYLPLNSVEDIRYMIKRLKQHERLKDCRVCLLGWSEGTVIAPLVAEKYPQLVDALFLAGYVNENMLDVMRWQENGGSQMAWFSGHFKADNEGRISKSAYADDPDGIVSTLLQGMPFEELDIDHDGYITKKDLQLRRSQALGYELQDVISAVERGDDEWLRVKYGKNIIPLTAGWFTQHFGLRSNMEVLPELELPIFIFHGTMDTHVDVAQVYKISEKFESLGKTNLRINVFNKHDHDLNYMDFITKKEISTGLKAIFDQVTELD